MYVLSTKCFYFPPNVLLSDTFVSYERIGSLQLVQIRARVSTPWTTNRIFFVSFFSIKIIIMIIIFCISVGLSNLYSFVSFYPYWCFLTLSTNNTTTLFDYESTHCNTKIEWTWTHRSIISDVLIDKLSITKCIISIIGSGRLE